MLINLITKRYQNYYNNKMKKALECLRRFRLNHKLNWKIIGAKFNIATLQGHGL